jgi:acyl carrier protein
MQLQINADFIEDLGLDSLDLVECVMFVEDEFGTFLSARRALSRLIFICAP